MKKQAKDETWADREVFTSPGTKIKTPWVTIMPRSTFLFNAAFVHRAHIKNFSQVILAYTESHKTVDFQFTSDDKAEGVYTLHHFEAGGTSVEAVSFFNHFLLKASELIGRYKPEKVRIPRVGEVWAINLGSKLSEK